MHQVFFGPDKTFAFQEISCILAAMKKLIVICGPTGIGKSRTALAIARELNCEIVSADSRQLFRELRIGTAVPDQADLNEIPHHFIRSHSIHDTYHASKYENEVLNFLDAYYKKKDQALLVGGSGMYIDAVCKGIDDLPGIDRNVRRKWTGIYDQSGIDALRRALQKADPAYYEVVDRNNPKRMLKALEVYEMTGKPYSGFLTKPRKNRPFETIMIGLNTDRSILYNRINARVLKMIEEGLVEEAKSVFPYRHLTPLKTVGYRELFEYFDGHLSLEEAIEQIQNHSRAYARRQLTWFRRYSDIVWFEPDDVTQILDFIDRKLNT